MVVLSYKAAIDSELVNTEPLILGDVQQVLE